MEMVTVCLCSHYLFVVTADIYLYALPFFFLLGINTHFQILLLFLILLSLYLLWREE